MGKNGWRYWDGKISQELLDDATMVRPVIAGMVWDALTYDPYEERRILYGDGSPLPTGVIRVEAERWSS